MPVQASIGDKACIFSKDTTSICDNCKEFFPQIYYIMQYKIKHIPFFSDQKVLTHLHLFGSYNIQVSFHNLH